MALAFAAQLLDAAAPTTPGAAQLVDALRPHVPADGLLHVAGRSRRRVHAAARLRAVPRRSGARRCSPRTSSTPSCERLADAQQPDGGWRGRLRQLLAAAELEWRGYRTVQALVLLRANGVL